jgi:hypothetical protein
MQLHEFIDQVSGFDALQHPDKIKLFAWYLHTHRGIEAFSNNGTFEAMISVTHLEYLL